MAAANRIAWIDYVKGVCMLFVILYHVMCIYVGDSLWAYSFKPFFITSFFFISGYLTYQGGVNRNKCKQSVISVIRRLVVPYFIFTTLIWIPKAISHGNEVSVMAYLKDVLGGYASWFVAALIVVRLLMVLFNSVSNKWSQVIFQCGGCFVFGVVLTKYCNCRFPWFANYGMISMLYIAIGILSRKYSLFVNDGRLVFKLITVALLYAAFVVLTFVYCPYLYVYELSSSNFSLDRLILYIPISFVGIFLIVLLCRLLPEKISPLRNIGRDSLIYYFLNGAIITTLTALANKLFEPSTLIAILIFFVTVVMLHIISPIINKYFPWAIGLRSGK
jgi:fucose 4-O-acetylase-like acetyltransferase